VLILSLSLWCAGLPAANSAQYEQLLEQLRRDLLTHMQLMMLEAQLNRSAGWQDPTFMVPDLCPGTSACGIVEAEELLAPQLPDNRSWVGELAERELTGRQGGSRQRRRQRSWCASEHMASLGGTDLAE